MNKKFIEQNQFICVTHGEYADTSVQGFFLALKQFDLLETFNLWAKDTGREQIRQGEVTSEENRKNNNPIFTEWMVENGYLKDLQYNELHTGNYGETMPFMY